jgi:hypothetical protein
MNISIALTAGNETPKVRITTMGDGSRFLSLALGTELSVCMCSYDEAAADYAIALADELYAAADKIRPAQEARAGRCRVRVRRDGRVHIWRSGPTGQWRLA